MHPAANGHERVQVRRVVSMAEMIVSKNPDDILVTYALGSCIGVTLYDPVAKIGGMIHCQLPASNTNPQEAQEYPCKYVDTGLLRLVQELYDRGARREKLVVKVAGSAKSTEGGMFFDLGKRNYVTLRKVFWKNRIFVDGESVGGSTPRTMSLHLATGKTFIRSEGTEVEI